MNDVIIIALAHARGRVAVVFIFRRKKDWAQGLLRVLLQPTTAYGICAESVGFVQCSVARDSRGRVVSFSPAVDSSPAARLPQPRPQK